MNEWDRDNLNFILGVDEREFEAWLSQLSKEDVIYALELFARHRNELVVAEMELLESAEELDCTEALSFINRVKEKL
jgi:CYTH domain-containing protein